MSLSRRQFMLISSAALGSLPLTRLRAWQSAPPATSFQIIRRNVGYFTAKGGTIGWLVSPNAVVVVDTQYPDTAKLCLDGLEQKSTRGIDLLFNTHHHADHTGGNGVFKPKSKKIVAHARVPELLKEVAKTTPNAPEPVLPGTTFDKTWAQDAGDEHITARHYGPGHTGGDSVIHFERANVAHMGDLLFFEMHPRVDRPAGANIQNWLKTLETVMKDMPASTTYIAGHAKPGTPVSHDRKALQQFRDYFDAVLTYSRKQIAAGKSKEELVKTESLPGFEGYHTAGARLSLGGVLDVAHDELTAK
jgi:glyoxylase-like metal-dependent hydrolase (beta-lactamase superfamily II)